MSKTLKFGILLLILLCLVLMALIIMDSPLGRVTTGFAGDESPTVDRDEQNLVNAVQIALANGTGHWQILEYQIHHIQIQDDGQMAVAWLAAFDRETGELISREPELALAKLRTDGNWQVLLNNEVGFFEVYKEFQYAEKNIHGDLLTESEVMPKSNRVLGGYYLPWAEGLEKRLSWSVGHTSCSPIYYCTHAFDFADGTMFPLVASKGGTVYHWKDSCANNDSNCMNSITLEDRSTTPWTYQIYMHIANNSIPTHLKQVGAPVLQGQYIADVDNTGPSTGHHVHFMVVSEDTKYMSWRGYVFGVAEDITFRDVNINWDPETQGGRPRLKYEAASYGGSGQTYYVSGNKPAFPPTGGLTSPRTKIYQTDQYLTVSGWGQDDTEVVKMELLVNYNGDWVEIGEEQIDNPFTTTVDLCETDIPNGPFQLGLRVWNYVGNPSPILTPRKLIKNIECDEVGINPSVSITQNEGTLALPRVGFVEAEVIKGSAESDIISVEFWFHGRDWSQNNWVYLGKDTDGSNGWQAPISTLGMAEASNYTIVAVATDDDGNIGVDVNFRAVVDKTPPSLNLDTIRSPIMDDSITLSWTAGDNLAGLDFYSLAVDINNHGFQELESNLPGTQTSYQYTVDEGQLLKFKLTAYDKSGNNASQKIVMYTRNYEFEYSCIFPLIFFNE